MDKGLHALWEIKTITVFLYPCQDTAVANGCYYLDPWVLIFWCKAYHACDSKCAWNAALNFLKKHQDSDLEAASFVDWLQMLEWNQKLPKPLDPGQSSVISLSAWCSYCWLHEPNMNQFTSFLASQIAKQSPPVDALLPPTDFFCSLFSLYNNHRRFSWSWIAFFVNVKVTHAGLAIRLPEDNIDPGNHWVGVIIDTGLREISFVNLYALPALPELMDILTWWLAQHNYVNFDQTPIMHMAQSDSYSCVGHHLLLHEIPLLDAKGCDTGHCHALRDIFECLLDLLTRPPIKSHSDSLGPVVVAEQTSQNCFSGIATQPRKKKTDTAAASAWKDVFRTSDGIFLVKGVAASINNQTQTKPTCIRKSEQAKGKASL
ncbi:hypothetical protein ARMGADRAFT_1039399 [Armillaria gallica]|uniref:Ubiquitin-like protease family profile domain-containing protein n=1 Tax=Armillaria gallica TaxID=47427 RepID=A0A2H3CX46_ARMGA|nr:hypothetical protein ARMGADRAFT_1039399 [Armillaria gallica]